MSDLGRFFAWPRKQFPDLFLVIVPEALKSEAEMWPSVEGARVKFIAVMSARIRRLKRGRGDCLLNSTGGAGAFYEHATVIFVGKSLTAEGGKI